MLSKLYYAYLRGQNGLKASLCSLRTAASSTAVAATTRPLPSSGQQPSYYYLEALFDPDSQGTEKIHVGSLDEDVIVFSLV